MSFNARKAKSPKLISCRRRVTPEFVPKYSDKMPGFGQCQVGYSLATKPESSRNIHNLCCKRIRATDTAKSKELHIRERRAVPKTVKGSGLVGVVRG